MASLNEASKLNTSVDMLVFDKRIKAKLAIQKVKALVTARMPFKTQEDKIELNTLLSHLDDV